jgi:hypothetical protein
VRRADSAADSGRDVVVSAASGLVGGCAGAPRPWARPKSITRTRPSSSIITLSGLRSRWTRPAACAAATPRATSVNARTSSASGCARAQSRSVRPVTNSMAIHTCAPRIPTSWMATMFGWDSRASAWASRCSRVAPVVPEVASASDRISLTATLRSRSGSYAAWTTPMLPAPTRPIRTYRPTRAPGARSWASCGSVAPPSSAVANAASVLSSSMATMVSATRRLRQRLDLGRPYARGSCAYSPASRLAAQVQRARKG